MDVVVVVAEEEVVAVIVTMTMMIILNADHILHLKEDVSVGVDVEELVLEAEAEVEEEREAVVEAEDHQEVHPPHRQRRWNIQVFAKRFWNVREVVDVVAAEAEDAVQTINLQKEGQREKALLPEEEVVAVAEDVAEESHLAHMAQPNMLKRRSEKQLENDNKNEEKLQKHSNKMKINLCVPHVEWDVVHSLSVAVEEVVAEAVDHQQSKRRQHQFHNMLCVAEAVTLCIRRRWKKSR